MWKWLLTPAEAEETLSYEPGPHLPNDSQVGLPRLRQYPAEGSQEEEMQEGSSHSAEALQRKAVERGMRYVEREKREKPRFVRGVKMNHLTRLVGAAKFKPLQK